MNMVKEYNVVLDRDNGKCMLKEIARYDYGEGTVRCSAPGDVLQLLDGTVHLTTLAEEYFYVICLNTCSEVLGISRISHGTVGFAVFTPREIYQRALLMGASKVIIAHNHPSQNVTPSKEDLESTKMVYEVGKSLSVQLEDSVIVGNGYFSFRESGLLTKEK